MLEDMAGLTFYLDSEIRHFSFIGACVPCCPFLGISVAKIAPSGPGTLAAGHWHSGSVSEVNPGDRDAPEHSREDHNWLSMGSKELIRHMSCFLNPALGSDFR
jgi:hypothetical protein